MKFKRSILLCILIICSYSAYNQGNVSIKFRTFSIIPRPGINYRLHTTSIDSSGRFLFEPGIELSYSHFVQEDKIAIKIAEGLYIDPAEQVAGYTHLGIRLRLHKKTSLARTNRHTLHLGLGPVLYYRNSWATLEGYQSESMVRSRGNMQYFIWVIGEVEYDYALRKRIDFSISLNYGYQSSVNFQLGMKFWISKNFKRDCGCH